MPTAFRFTDQPSIMGILNITPDSFSDGGQYSCLNRAIERAKQMIDHGVDWIDVGGESTRPGATPVPLQQELDRVIPVIQALVSLGKPISIDTNKAEVMCAAVEAGATMINDIYALQNDGALAVAAKLEVPICLMHMQGRPKTMQHNPSYSDIVVEIKHFLLQRIQACTEAGIDKSRLCLDPGFGFGKSLQDNWYLLNNLRQFQEFELPILVGLSRKSMLAAMTHQPSDSRMIASVAAALMALERGASILRVHDVAETKQALRVFQACR